MSRWTRLSPRADPESLEAVSFRLYIAPSLQTIISLLASQLTSFKSVYLALTASLKVKCYFQTRRGLERAEFLSMPPFPDFFNTLVFMQDATN